MDKESAKIDQQEGGPLGRRISRRQAIKLGGLATLGLAFHKPVIETIKPTQIFANNCYGCQSAALYSPSPIFTGNPFQDPVILTTSITFCVDDAIYSAQGLTVQLVDTDLISDTVLAEQTVPISTNDLPGTCIQGRVLTWELACNFQGNVQVPGGGDTGEISPFLSVKFGGQKVGQVRAFGCG